MLKSVCTITPHILQAHGTSAGEGRACRRILERSRQYFSGDRKAVADAPSPATRRIGGVDHTVADDRLFLTTIPDSDLDLEHERDAYNAYCEHDTCVEWPA